MFFAVEDTTRTLFKIDKYKNLNDVDWNSARMKETVTQCMNNDEIETCKQDVHPESCTASKSAEPSCGRTHSSLQDGSKTKSNHIIKLFNKIL